MRADPFRCLVVWFYATHDHGDENSSDLGIAFLAAESSMLEFTGAIPVVILQCCIIVVIDVKHWTACIRITEGKSGICIELKVVPFHLGLL
jgi:hypothetical protein